MSNRRPQLYIAPSSIDERGVFTAEDLQATSLLEICPVILIPATDMDHLKKTELFNYYFDWDEQKGSAAIALGYGSLYNHAYRPNAEYRLDYETNTLSFYALKDIEAGSEITINYNGDPKNQEKVWFDQ